MTDDKHTPEPWHVAAGCDVATDPDNTGAGYPPPAGLICSTHDGEYIENPNSVADARRIVACVNACRGMSTEALEQLGAMAQDRLDAAQWFWFGRTDTETGKRAEDALTLTAQAAGVYHVTGQHPDEECTGLGGGSMRVTRYFDKGDTIKAECPWCHAPLLDLADGFLVP